jgi:antitoxin component YwqK of YwqJK toxin-antitoxin module
MKKKATLKFPDGSKYVGEVKNGIPHGQGTTTYPNGTIKKGIWKNNELVEPN